MIKGIAQIKNSGKRERNEFNCTLFLNRDKEHLFMKYQDREEYKSYWLKFSDIKKCESFQGFKLELVYD